MTAIGTIYVPVRGDTTQFQKDMNNLRTWAHRSGTEVADALNSAISKSTAGKGVTTLANNLKQLAQGAKAPMDQFATTANALSKELEHVALKAGMTKQQFSDMTEKMLKNQALNTAAVSLKNIATVMGLSTQEAKALAVQMGYTGAQILQMSKGFNAAHIQALAMNKAFDKSKIDAVAASAAAGLWIGV
jgi:hypothetical protein